MTPRPRRTSLRVRILAWVFIPTTIVLVAVGLVMYFAYWRLAEELVVGRNEERTRLAAGQLGEDLGNYRNILVGLGRIASFYQGDPQAESAFLQRVDNLLTVFDGGAMFLDSAGRVAAVAPEQTATHSQDWSGVGVFRQVARALQPAISDIIAGQGEERASIAIAVPILNVQGEFGGALVGIFHLGATSFSPFYGGFNKLRIGENNTLLVDGTGRAIYHTDPGQMGQDFGGQEAIQRALGGATGHLYVRDAQGRDILATFAPVPGTSWGLVNEENWAGLLASSRNYGYMLLALLALGVAIPAAVVAVGLRRLTEPMASLIAGAKEVASGKFGQAIRVRTSDELEELVNQFNLMSAQLKAREERLDLIVHGTIDGIWDWNFLTGEVYLSPRWKAMLGFGEDEERNWLQEIPALLHPEDLPNVVAQIQAQVDRPHYTVEYRLRHRDGSYRWILARGVALKDDEGRPYRVAGSQTDITELKRAQEALQQAYQTLEQRVEERTREIERRRQVAEGLREIVTVLNSRQSLPDILEVIATQARRLLGSDAMALYRLDRETNALSILAAHGLDPDYVASMAIPVGKGAVGLAVYRREPVKVLDAVASMAVVSDPTLTMQKRSMLEALISRYRSLLAVPLIIKDDIYGAITLYYQSFREFTDEEISLVVSFADQAALAIENARLREQAEQAAVVAERNRLARDLHDAVTQSLYSVTLYAEAAVRLLNSGDHTTAAKHLRELRDTAQEALREMRLLIFELRPLALEKSGLAAALQARLEAVEGRTGIQVELNVVGAEYADGLPYGVQEELYHIAQEALNNVLKHAHARHVRVSLSVSEGATCLEISDDGVSFDPAQAAQAGGLGLAGMKERAQKIGGTIDFDCAPGQGTKVIITVLVSASATPTIPKTTQPSSQPVGG